MDLFPLNKPPIDVATTVHWQVVHLLEGAKRYVIN